jgi:hypothetical protein
MTSPLTKITVDMEEVHDMSVDLLEFFQQTDTNVGVGILALIMTVGRLMSPTVMEEDEEANFIQAVMEYCGMCFAGGMVN